MKVRGRVVLKVPAEATQARLSRFATGVAARGMADTDRGEHGAVVVVVLVRRPVAFEPVPGSVGLLERPHPVEGAAGQRMERPGRRGVVQRQGHGGGHDLGVPPGLCPLRVVVPVGDPMLEERADLAQRRRFERARRRPADQVGIVRVAGAALPLPGPVERDRVEELRRTGEREAIGHRLIGSVRRRGDHRDDGLRRAGIPTFTRRAITMAAVASTPAMPTAKARRPFMDVSQRSNA